MVVHWEHPRQWGAMKGMAWKKVLGWAMKRVPMIPLAIETNLDLRMVEWTLKGKRKVNC